MSTTVKFSRPYEWKGGTAGDPDFIRQDGMIFGWSESNVRYELAWWLYPGTPESPLVLALCKERPLPEGDWQPSDSYMALDGRGIGGFM